MRGESFLIFYSLNNSYIQSVPIRNTAMVVQVWLPFLPQRTLLIRVHLRPGCTLEGLRKLG